MLAAVIAPQTSSPVAIALPYSAQPAPPPPSSSSSAAAAAHSSRFVPATSAAAASKHPPTPVIVTATPLPSLGPLRPPLPEYEPGASGAVSRMSAQYTDWLRRRAETLMQKRLRTQVLAPRHIFIRFYSTLALAQSHCPCSSYTVG